MWILFYSVVGFFVFIALIIWGPRLLKFAHAGWLWSRDSSGLPYNVHGFVGLYGGGKTLAMSLHARDFRKKYPNGIITSNYNLSIEDFPFNSLNDLIRVALNYGPLHDVPILICFDEIQNTFQARNYQKFPKELIWLLSQVRKFDMTFLYTTQREGFADSIIRNLTNYLYVMQNPYNNNRLFFMGSYYATDYQFDLQPEQKQARILSKEWIVATDNIYSIYDTLAVVDPLTDVIADEDLSEKIYKATGADSHA